MFDSIGQWLNDISQNLPGALGLFAVGLILLIKGGDWFVDSASNLAKRFHTCRKSSSVQPWFPWARPFRK